MSRKLGTLTVLELHIFCQEYGRGFLPYPFRFTKPVPYQYEDDLSRFRTELLERFAAGELDHLRRWLDVQIRDAEIRVESMVMNASEVTVALSATRWNDLGFLATQEAEDVISVSQLSAYDLGPEIGRLAALSGTPGSHPKVTVPSLNVQARSRQPAWAGSMIVDEVKVVDPGVAIPFEDLVAGGEIYTDYRPPRRWRPDRTKEFLGWLNTADGDYVVQAPYEYATPVTRKQLIAKIDQLIAADAAEIRELREIDDPLSGQ
jgi:ESAT-6 protein secretion system EspG family protein